jgi:hypothetical protein
MILAAPKTIMKACISTSLIMTRKAGGWFRIGNRPNENYAEVSVCVYLPDGRVGFTFARADISRAMTKWKPVA